MGKCCLHASSFIFDRIIIKVIGNQDRHKSSDKCDFGPDQTTHFGVTCPWMTKILHIWKGERGGSVVECRTPEREVRGSRPTAAMLCPWARHFTPRKYWLITQEAMAPSRHDWKIVDWDVKPQHNQHIWKLISLRPVGQSWSNFMCCIIEGGERLHKVLRQIGSKLWRPWQQKAPTDL